MFNRLRTEKVYCGIDIGNNKIKAALFSIKDDKDPEILGVFEHKSHGYKDGSVTDLNELAECVHYTVNELSKKTETKILQVSLGAGGDLVDSRNVHTAIPLIDRGNRIIVSSDIKKVTEQARLLGLKMEEEILHDLVQRFEVDDVNMAQNPKGLFARKLGVHSIMLIADLNRLRNIVKAVQHAGYEVENVFFSSYVSSHIVLNEEEMKDGSILIDIGSKVTSIFIFKNKVLQYFDKIYMGGDDFTTNIAQELKLSFDMAEEIKKSYADVQYSLFQEEEEILVKRESAYIPIKRKQIYQAIEPQVERLFYAMNNALGKSGYLEQVNCGMTFVGGGALLPGLIEKIGSVVNMPVRMGKVHLQLKKRLSNAALFTSVIGLAYAGYLKQLKSGINNEDGNLTTLIMNRIKELYQEYF